MITERIKRLEKLSKERGKECRPTHFNYDYNRAALEEFSDLPHAEKLVRAMAYAIVNQDVFAYDDDRIGGRIYYSRERAVEKKCPELDYSTEAEKLVREKYPEIPELKQYQLVTGVSRGHITWFFDRILNLGTEGMKRMVEDALSRAADDEAREFHRGVLIMLDALQAYNDKHIAEYRRLGNNELADIMERVPRNPAETFREAVQAFFMQHIVVMRENPYGGNGPGRLDYYLWPYLERDLKKGIITLNEAKELIDELFLRIDERIFNSDMWVEAIAVGGSYPNGTSAVNPLTYIMVRSVMDLNIIHPAIYIRVPEEPDEELIALCSQFILSGNNRAQILSDKAIIGALVKNGHTYRDAVEYACGGCMEVAVQGMSSDFLFNGFQNTPKMLELMITGGECLNTGKTVQAFHATRGLTAYSDFESFYRDFIAEAARITELSLAQLEIYSYYAEKNRPTYLVSSMIDDCIARGRNMHAGGAKFHDYGATHIGMPNTADGLFAIKKAVFDDKICSAEELINAMKANFKGYEKLRAKLRAIPKYGEDNDEIDALANRLMSDFSDMYLGYKTRWGGKGVPVILTFVYSPSAASILGATPDGREAHCGIAHGVTPHSGSMSCGLSAAINSIGKISFDKFAGGASTMWDFDSSWVTEDIVSAVLKTFLEKGGQIFQGNTTPVEELMEAKLHPENYEHLMVRVGGFSARFVNLRPELQDEIISRIHHAG